MTLFFLLRLLHLAAMIVWLGVGLSIPVTLDIRRSLALGIAHGKGLVARGDQQEAEAAGRRFTFWVRCEDVLRVSTLALMVLPV